LVVPPPAAVGEVGLSGVPLHAVIVTAAASAAPVIQYVLVIV
jgi:hypothetical protein